ncbi:hypothetical protein ACFYSW_27745 [Rhodococcus aetherivorans]|uniref:hypothetical protein n=1 Tax=Rhodococcus aetherivorans TaxID=191292 RepID=UPI00367794D6
MPEQGRVVRGEPVDGAEEGGAVVAFPTPALRPVVGAAVDSADRQCREPLVDLGQQGRDERVEPPVGAQQAVQFLLEEVLEVLFVIGTGDAEVTTGGVAMGRHQRLQGVDGLVDHRVGVGEVDRGQCLRVGAEAGRVGVDEAGLRVVEDVERIALDRLGLDGGRGGAAAQDVAEAEALLFVVEQVLADLSAVESAEDRHCGPDRAFFEVANHFFSREERDHSVERSRGQHDLGVGDGGLGGRGGREPVVVRVGAEQLAHHGGLSRPGGAEQQDLPVAVLSGGQGQELVAHRGGGSGSAHAVGVGGGMFTGRHVGLLRGIGRVQRGK